MFDTKLAKHNWADHVLVSIKKNKKLKTVVFKFRYVPLFIQK